MTATRGTWGICCDALRYAVTENEIPLVFVAKFREVGIAVLDGGPSYIQLKACPWCGRSLPESLRDEWFNEMDRRGIDPASDDVPAEFTDHRWYSRGVAKTVSPRHMQASRAAKPKARKGMKRKAAKKR